MLLATGVAVIARHPIARAIGTEADEPTMTPSVVATAPPSPTTASAPSVGAVVAPAPTHAPRDPFHALVAAGQAILTRPSNVTATVATPGAGTFPFPASAPPSTSVQAGSAVASPPKSVGTAPAAVSSTCAGSVHTVVAGDTLWSIAAKVVKSSDIGRVNVAWHRIYKANQPPLGDNPSLVPVGAKLCIPSSV